ncbi:MAG: hypothetical protein JNL21_32960 [Myxococcales bacterium]|nr:hypothetical protein [Myxococcales bacterium]
MALAHLEYVGPERGKRVFLAELGSTNRYWQWAVGDDDVQRTEIGINVLAKPRHVSPLLGPLPPERLGRITIGIPESLFDEENQNVQLKSFRDERLNGPAVSDVVRAWGGQGHDALPSVAFALEAEAERRCESMRSVPYRFGPSAPGRSQAMFLDAILKAIPAALPALGSLFGGGAAGNKPGGGSPLEALLGAIGNKDIQELIKTLLAQVGTAKAQGLGASNAQALEVAEPYAPARAMIAPALLAALPALTPLLEKALNPETVKAILGAADPSKVIGAVSGALKDLAGVGIENQKVILDHLKAVHPSLDDKDLMGLLASMSAPGATVVTEGPQSFRRASKVKLTFLGMRPHSIDGRDQVLFLLGRSLRFPVDVQTPRPLGKALVEVTLRHLESHALIGRKRATVEISGAGPLAKVPMFDAETLSGVEPGTDCLLTVTVSWTNKAGQRVGTSVSQWIKLVRETVFAGAKRAGNATPLDDVTRYREFWHKVWEGPFDDARRRVGLQVKYCYALQPGARENGRMESKVLLEPPANGRVEGKVKAGLLLSAVALNSLLPRLFEKPALSSADLDALERRDAADRLGTCAHARVFLSGRPRGGAAVWVFPDVALHEVSLRAVTSADESGQVQGLAERSVLFPLPVAAHFIGTRSAQ